MKSQYKEEMKVLIERRAIFQKTHELCPLSFHCTFCRRISIIPTETEYFKEHSFEMQWPRTLRYHLRIWKTHKAKVNTLSVAESRGLEFDRHSFKYSSQGVSCGFGAEAALWDAGFCTFTHGKGFREVPLSAFLNIK